MKKLCIGRVRVLVKYPDGTEHTWLEFASTHGVKRQILKGDSAKRAYLNRHKKLPRGYNEITVCKEKILS